MGFISVIFVELVNGIDNPLRNKMMTNMDWYGGFLSRGVPQ